MICLIAPTYQKAKAFAEIQQLKNEEWFYYSEDNDVMIRCNFHTLIVGTFEDNRLNWFEKAWRLARIRGAINRI